MKNREECCEGEGREFLKVSAKLLLGHSHLCIRDDIRKAVPRTSMIIIIVILNPDFFSLYFLFLFFFFVRKYIFFIIYFFK